MADASTMITAASSFAPANAENNTVILWAVGLLVIVAVFLAKHLLDTLKQNKSECREENAKAWSKVEERDEELKAMRREGVVSNAATATAMVRMSDAVDELTSVVRGSGMHRKSGDPA